jgi:hypothetical protein
MIAFMVQLPVLHVAPEVVQQLLKRGQNVVFFSLPNVPVVTFAALVVVAHSSRAASTKVESVLVTVRAWQQWLRQFPNNDFDNRAIVANFLGPNEEDGQAYIAL